VQHEAQRRDVGALANIVGNAIDSVNTSQAGQQIQMPKGKVKFAFAAWRGYTNTSTVEAFLQKGTFGAGADTASDGAGRTTGPLGSTLLSFVWNSARTHWLFSILIFSHAAFPT
jgi:hypothetical protein